MSLLFGLLLPGMVGASPLVGFEPRGDFGDQVCEATTESGVRITWQAPPAADWSSTMPLTLVVYALPNGNSTEQTMGRRLTPDLHWRHDIQHIAAQTRTLRAADPDRQWVTVYLEANTRSFPAWRRERGETGNGDIQDLFAQVRAPFDARDHDVVLTGHSGGGSLTFGFLNAHEAIPAWVSRIAFLDSNYAYDTAAGHGAKLADWLRGDPRRVLAALCYDDRFVELDGKRIVSDTGGTWRSTERMMEGVGRTLTESTHGAYRRLYDRQVEVLMHPNPELKILHTVMVGEHNGLIHVLTLRTPLENRVAEFGGARAYERWIDSQ